MSWIKNNWKKALAVIAAGTMALAADHTIGYKIAAQVYNVVTNPAPAPVVPAK